MMTLTWSMTYFKAVLETGFFLSFVSLPAPSLRLSSEPVREPIREPIRGPKGFTHLSLDTRHAPCIVVSRIESPLT